MRPPSNPVIAAKSDCERTKPVGGPPPPVTGRPRRASTVSEFRSFWCLPGADVLSSVGTTVGKSTVIIMAGLIASGVDGVSINIDGSRNKGQLLSVQCDGFAVNIA